ncbi:hypothetical protein ScPMuIL_009345 [Solemya velum]
MMGPNMERIRLYFCRTRKSFTKYKLGTVILLVFLYFVWNVPVMTIFDLCDRPHYISMEFTGGVGNKMFQYAMMYASSRDKALTMATELPIELTDVFNVDEAISNTQVAKLRKFYCFKTIEDARDCAFESNVTTTKNDGDIHFKGYFQSWMYWVTYENELRAIFQIKSNITAKAQRYIGDLLLKNNITKQELEDLVFIGIHIRGGDMLTPSKQDFGYQIATEQYIHNAVGYFNGRFRKTIYIVCSNNMIWAKSVLSKYANMKYVENMTWELDMAILSLTNHSIMTVGTFGWWIAWLTGGQTVYYKYPFRPGSELSKMYSSTQKDHFYPSWVGLE